MKMENDKNLVSINTEKFSGKLTIHIPLLSCSDSPWSDNALNQLKEIYFLEVREIVELISCQASDAITVMCVPKRH